MYLHNYMGMIGVPMDLYPEFPEDRGTILLTEAAKYDPNIVAKVLKHLNNDKTVVITTGLLKALQGKGIEKVVEVEYTGRKALVNNFTFRRVMDEEPANIYHSDSEILVPELAYGLVDSEEIIQGIYKENNRYSMLLQVRGLKKGRFFILTIPENFDDLYHLPPEVLSQIRRDLMEDIPVYLDSPARICLYRVRQQDVHRQVVPAVSRSLQHCREETRGPALRPAVGPGRMQGYVNGDTTLFEVSGTSRERTTCTVSSDRIRVSSKAERRTQP